MLGLSLSTATLVHILREYDIDEQGKISWQEFQHFINCKRSELQSRLVDLKYFPVMALDAKSSPPLTSSGSSPYSPPIRTVKAKYLVPTQGKVSIELTDTFVSKPLFKTLSSLELESAQAFALRGTAADSYSSLIVHIFTFCRLRADEAYAIFDSIYKENAAWTTAAVAPLPYLFSADEARYYKNKVVSNDHKHMTTFHEATKDIWAALSGSPDGYYDLNLSLPSSRLCLRHLLVLSYTHAHSVGIASPVGRGRSGDTSARGNWSCFRNEVFNSVAVTVDRTSFGDKIHRGGTLQFDFISRHRVVPSPAHVLENCRLLGTKDISCKKNSIFLSLRKTSYFVSFLNYFI